jgi:hypothetical protein
MRIQFPMTFEDEIVAKWFGLETARILLDSSDRLFAIARYESEKRLAKQSRRGRNSDKFARRGFSRCSSATSINCFSRSVDP